MARCIQAVLQVLKSTPLIRHRDFLSFDSLLMFILGFSETLDFIESQRERGIQGFELIPAQMGFENFKVGNQGLITPRFARLPLK